MTHSLEQPPEERRLARRRARYAAREILWAESKLRSKSGVRRPAYCGRYAAGESVTVLAGGEAGAGLAGVQSCGSVWVCPVCSEKINAARRNELTAGVEAWISAGGGVEFGTLTLSHHEGDRLADLWDAIGPAWNRATSGAGVAWNGSKGAGGSGVTTGDRWAFGISGYVRVVETKHGVNGWHPHVHFLLFTVQPLDARRRALLAGRLFGRWEAAVNKAGYRTSWAHGIDLRPVETASGVGEYLAKNDYRATPGGAAFEVTGSHSKTAGKGGRTPFELLAAVVDQGDADDLDRWHEWEKASQGRRQLTWSRGMRTWLALAGAEVDALTDEEIAEQNAGGVAVLEISREGFRRLAASGRVVALLEAVERGWDGAAELLDALRVQYWPPGGVALAA